MTCILSGPRAEWVKLSDKYTDKINYYSKRHTVRPGITGWAQIIIHMASI